MSGAARAPLSIPGFRPSLAYTPYVGVFYRNSPGRALPRFSGHFLHTKSTCIPEETLGGCQS